MRQGKSWHFSRPLTRTRGRWLGEILPSFEHRTTSGVVEDINNRLKLIKPSGYGVRNFERFKLRGLISWHFPTSAASLIR